MMKKSSMKMAPKGRMPPMSTLKAAPMYQACCGTWCGLVVDGTGGCGVVWCVVCGVVWWCVCVCEREREREREGECVCVLPPVVVGGGEVEHGRVAASVHRRAHLYNRQWIPPG